MIISINIENFTSESLLLMQTKNNTTDKNIRDTADSLFFIVFK